MTEQSPLELGETKQEPAYIVLQHANYMERELGRLWLNGDDAKEKAAFIVRAVNCHEELVKALEPFGYDDPQGDCFSDDAPVEIRCEGYVLLTATAGDLRQAAAALAKAKETP